VPGDSLRAHRSFLLEPHTDLNSVDPPEIITQGEGVWVIDAEGRRYLEGVAGLWCAILGFSDERLVEAANRQFRQLAFYGSFNHRTHNVVVELAERLTRIAPVPMAKAFFANSGSEVNDTAIKMAWFVNSALGRPLRRKIVAHDRGYHGATVAAASVTGLPHMHRGFGLPAIPVVHVASPDYCHESYAGESEEDFSARMVADVERTILQEDPDTIAAFISEPVLGAGGLVIPPCAYFERLQELLHRFDILFIVDEIITGFGRTGKMFGSETFNLKPDMIAVAKGLSAAYLPISALLVNDKVAGALIDGSREFGAFSHGFTYSGHPVACAVALEALTIYDDIDVAAQSRTVGAILRAHLSSLGDHPLVSNIRSCGLLAGVDVEHAARVVEQARKHGVILRAMGDTVVFAPAVVMSAHEIELAVERFRLGLNDVMKSQTACDRLSPAELAAGSHR
jgi:4-aminobutyrate---pyruvate transaminase